MNMKFYKYELILDDIIIDVGVVSAMSEKAAEAKIENEIMPQKPCDTYYMEKITPE